MADVFVNKVAESGLLTLDLEELIPSGEIVGFDLKGFLFMELILKEKDYREQLKNFDWSIYTKKIVAVHCSADAIIPMWAYMLAAVYIAPVASHVVFANPSDAEHKLLMEAIAQLDVGAYAGMRVVVKGCGEKVISEEAYLKITARLVGVARSIMYGEPCSTVPIFKRKV